MKIDISLTFTKPPTLPPSFRQRGLYVNDPLLILEGSLYIQVYGYIALSSVPVNA